MPLNGKNIFLIQSSSNKMWQSIKLWYLYFFSVLILMCIFKLKRNIYHLLIHISWPTIQLVSSCHFQLHLTRWCGDYEVPLILGYCLEMTRLLQKKSRKIIHKTRIFVFYFKDANSITNFTIIFIILFISN